MKNGKIIVWSSLLGFDRNDADRGVARFTEQTGFVPDGVVALLHHSDFFNLYEDMNEERTLSPDNCSYYGIPRTAERERQPWTNYDLRALAENLEKAGSGLYASIFGATMGNAFHREWVTDHPEVMRHGRGGVENAAGIFPLKRLKDGSYYEDFFIEKVCRALKDYSLKGIHLADGFCPPAGGMLHSMEFSTDYVEQFLEHSGVELPEAIASRLGDDSADAEGERADWIYQNRKVEWVEFNAWRWERFFGKLCTRVHSIGKEVWALGMYCTDPFETLYCIGIDLKRIVNAGVDCITANILPTSCYVLGKDEGKEQRTYYFHRYMAIVSTAAAYLPRGHMITMLGLQDPTEEWSIMHHLPCQHERDMYTMMSYQLIDGEGMSRASDGFMLCLGEGIPASDWRWERERLEAALTSGETAEILSPAMLWSDNVQDAMLKAYTCDRRWTPFKHFYEMAKAGTHLVATVRPEGLKNYSRALFVPNFDLLSEDEKAAVAAYKGAVLCTAQGNINPEAYGIKTEILFTDKFSNNPITVFAFNCKIGEDTRAKISELLSLDDGKPNLEGDLNLIKEPDYTLMDTLIYSKVTEGFRDAMALALKEISDIPFEINKAAIAVKMNDGAYRLYLFNDSEIKYHRAFVKSEKEILKTRTVSKFPVLPPRFVESATGTLHFAYNGEPQVKKNFEVKLQPAGVTVIDVYCKE